MRKHKPQLAAGVERIAAAWPDDRSLRDIYPTLEKTSIDFAVMEHASDVIPVDVPDGMVADGVEHAAIALAIVGGARRGARPVCQLIGALLVAQGVVQPGRLDPAGALGFRHAHRASPLVEQRRDPLDVRPALGGDDGPGGEGHREISPRPMVPTLKRGLGGTLC